MPLCFPYFAVTLLMSIFANNVTHFLPGYNGECDKLRKSQRDKLYFGLILVVLCAFCAFKYVSAVSVDEWAYRRRFVFYQNLTFQGMLQYAIINGSEYLNSFLVWCSTRLFKTDQGIFIVFGSLTALFYLLGIRKYSRDFSFAIALLMITGIIVVSFNVTQHSLACALLFYYSNYIYERKFWKFLLVVLVCAMIHSSSLIFLAFYPLCSAGRKKSGTLSYITLFTIGIVIIYRGIPVLSTYIPLLESYVDSATEGHAGVRLITIAIQCVPGLMALLFENSVDPDDRVTALSGRMAIVNMGIYMASALDRYIARLGMFTAPFCVIYLSRSLGIFRRRDNATLFKLVTVFLYGLEFFLRYRYDVYYFNVSF